jgi:hypothetical protein
MALAAEQLKMNPKKSTNLPDLVDPQLFSLISRPNTSFLPILVHDEFKVCDWVRLSSMQAVVRQLYLSNRRSDWTLTMTKSSAATIPPSAVRLCSVEIHGPWVKPSFACQGMRCDEFPDSTKNVELVASRISLAAFFSVESCTKVSEVGPRKDQNDLL